LVATAVGCAEPVPESSQPAPPPVSTFDAASAGGVRGRVTWAGPLPDVPSLEVMAYPFGGPVLRQRQSRPNPNAPVIDPQTRGVGNAVVFLRGVEARRARPWDHPPAAVELHSDGFRVRQGEAVGGVGFVRRGEAAMLVSREDVVHGCRARGAAFFTLMFPDRDRPLERRLAERGVVELSSAAGFYWARAYLFVDDHPYYARTDPQGAFALTGVPPGRYELVCWMPNWKVRRREREPEVGTVVRLEFEPPVETVQPLTVSPAEERVVDVTLR
jgi:hypothetical protein